MLLVSCAVNNVPLQRPSAKNENTSGSLPLTINVWIPEAVQRCAAWILVCIPPVPTLLPAPPAMASMSGVIRSTLSISLACGFFRGSASNKPSISEQIMQVSACATNAVYAAKLSLSPTLSSLMATVSFSFTIGMA